jgi:hypothetical protein
MPIPPGETPSPQSVPLLQRALQAEEVGDFESALIDFRHLASFQPENPRWPLEAVRVLLKLGRNDEAAAAFRAVSARWPRAMSDEHLRALVPGADLTAENTRNALADQCPPDSALKRAVIVDDEAAEVQTVRGGRDVVVLVFTGLADRLVMPVPVFDRYLAELDVSAIYLRDRRRMAYFHGIRGLGGDHEQTVEALKGRLQALGAKSVHTLGNSAGGIGALSYGLDLGAASVLGFATPCDLSDSTGDWDPRAPVFSERLRTLTPWALRDFRSRLAASEHPPRVDLWYGADNENDRRHAESMSHAPSVTLHPLAGVEGHGALFALAQQGGLSAALKEKLGEP